MRTDIGQPSYLMLHDTTRKYLERSGFTGMQSEALADLHAELSAMIAELSSQFATKTDLHSVKADLHSVKAELKSDMALLRKDLDLIEARLENRMSALESRLTWRFIALTAFLGTVLSLINIFVA